MKTSGHVHWRCHGSACSNHAALLYRPQWDELLHRQFEKVRLVFMPIVNPGGMWAHKPANPRGVDLMRNAPQCSKAIVSLRSHPRRQCVFAHDAGTGRMNWIFLRGLARETRHWGDFMIRFEACMTPSAVTALDLPGTGKFHTPGPPLKVQDMVMFSRWQLLAAARFGCAAQSPHRPTLVLSSLADQLINPVCSTQLADACQAVHHAHPLVGHDLAHDDGLWVCECVKE